MQMLALFGWFVATFGPIGIAVLFWRVAKLFRHGWILHLLFLPCTVALYVAGEKVILFATDYTDFDHTLGGPVLQARALFPIAVSGLRRRGPDRGARAGETPGRRSCIAR